MIVRYSETDLNTLYNNMHGVIRLGDVARLIPGYYSKYSSIFKLTNCEIKDDLRIEGYSTILRRKVIVEQDAVRALVMAKDVVDFKNADLQMYSTFLITVNHHDEDFQYRYPLTAQYLTECSEESLYDNLHEIGTILRPSIREAMDKKKLLLTTSGNITHAMLDGNTHLLPTIGTYMCTFPHEDWRTHVAYMAILNSRTFSYIFNFRMHDGDKKGEGLKAILSDIPVPRVSECFVILEYLSEYLLYLSQPELLPISNRISNERLGFYLTKILDMVVYELYFPEYVYDRNLNAIEYINSAPFMQSPIVDEEHIWETYSWFQRPDNVIRQMIEVLDTRSPELLYKIQTFEPNE